MSHWFSRLFRKEIRLIDKLPPLSGRVVENEPLNRKTWFGVGGPASVYIEPADVSDLSMLMRFFPDEPLTIIGAGTNVLIRDGGVPGITLHLGKPFSTVRVDGDKLICGAAASVMEVARIAEKNQLTGFEFLSGIPGSVGGALRMNAGAFKQSVSDRLVSILVMMANGEVTEINPREMDIYEYRKCFLPNDWIFLEAAFQGEKVKNPETIRNKMLDYKKKRESSQPQGVRTAGSTFKNPDGLMAWKLIENAGLRGVKIGGAVVSDKHANFLINTGNATAKDIETLGELIREKVQKTQGVTLEWEVRKLGVEK